MTSRAASVRPSQALEEGRSPEGRGLRGPRAVPGAQALPFTVGAGCRVPTSWAGETGWGRAFSPARGSSARAPRGPFQTRAASSSFLPVAPTLLASERPGILSPSCARAHSGAFQLCKDGNSQQLFWGVGTSGRFTHSQAALTLGSSSPGGALPEHAPPPHPHSS